MTKDEIKFYGVKVAITKTGNSFDEPSFQKVVWPGGWSKDDTLPPVPGMDPRAQQFYDFFQPLIHEMLLTRFADRSTQYFDFTGRYFPSQFDRDIGYAVDFWKNSAWVSLYIRTWESLSQNKLIFDALKDVQTEI